MLADDTPLIDLAGAVADGAPVDWDGAESSAGNPELQDAIQQLRILADMAAVHRRAAAEAAVESPRDPAETRDTRWGPLELRRQIGNGHFGTVYLAWDPNLEREVALKILKDADRSASV